MVPDALLELAHRLAEPSADLCILAEGNVSCLDAAGDMWIKGSGAQMGTLDASGVSRVKLDATLRLLELDPGDATAVRTALNQCCLNLDVAAPSTETFMHAALLNDSGAKFVAHTHPTPLLSLLCMPDAEFYSRQRLFPDEIVLCGPSSCFVPYVAPGLPLARAVRERATKYADKQGFWPKTIWLQNHGLICAGQTANEVFAASLMSVKAARVTLGVLRTKQEPMWLSAAQIAEIHHWPDEHARQRKLYG